jgi:O-antigen/teichoic acid export membrane protein
MFNNLLEIKNKFFKSKLASNALIYVVSEVLVKAIPIFLIPLLTHKLSSTDYGRLISFQTISYFLNIIVALGTYSIIWPFLNEVNGNKEALKKTISSFLITPFFVAAICLTVFVFFFKDSFLGLPKIWIILAIFLAIFEYAINVLSFIWVFEKKAWHNAIFKVSRTVVEIISIFIIFNYFGLNWQNRINSILITGAIIGLYTFLYFYRHNLITLKIGKEQLKVNLKASIPAIPYELNLSLRQLVERWLIITILGLPAMGIFGLAIQLTIPLHLLGVAFLNALIPSFYEKINKNLKKETIKLVKIYCVVLVGALFAYLIALYFTYKYFIGVNYYSAIPIAIIVCVAVLIRSFHGLLSQFLLYYKKTLLSTQIATVSTIFGILTMWIALKTNMLLGGAFAVLFVELFTFIIIFYFSNKVYPLFFKTPAQ